MKQFKKLMNNKHLPLDQILLIYMWKSQLKQNNFIKHQNYL